MTSTDMTPLAAGGPQPTDAAIHVNFADLQAMLAAFVADPAVELGRLAAAECIAEAVSSVVEWASVTDPAKAFEAMAFGLDAFTALRTGAGDVRGLLIRALRLGFSA